MFGTLKPHACRLGCAGRREYERFYCGLCKSLGDGFGQLSRALVSYDAVFLALVADGLVAEGAEPDRCRCPLLPVTFRPTVRPDSPAMRYAAAMTMLLSDQWLADRAMDGKRSAKAARPLLAGRVEAAHAILGELGISLADLDGFEEQQARTEVRGRTGPRDAAEPTASALARVFERMVLLPGVPEEARVDGTRKALAAFGRRLGSAIYLIDALDDLEKDHRGGAFNPCLDPRGEVSWDRVEEAWALLRDDLAVLDDLSTTLPLRRHRDLVHEVVVVELRRQAQAAARRAHAHARAEHARLASERRRQSWARRALAGVATAFVLFWVWLSSIPALAFGPKRPSVPPRRADAGAAPSSTAPPETWNPDLPPPSSASAAPEPPPTTRPESSRSPTTPDAPGTKPGGEDPTRPGGGSSSSPAPSSPGGSGCPNPCSGCGNFCKSCTNCCDGCKSPDCSGCSKPCDGCSSCCNCNACSGCNNCNSCCR